MTPSNGAQSSSDWDVCPDCDGAEGHAEGNEWINCATCEGQGGWSSPSSAKRKDAAYIVRSYLNGYSNAIQPPIPIPDYWVSRFDALKALDVLEKSK